MKIAVARAGLSLFDCHQAVKNDKNCSVIESFYVYYCQFTKIKF